MAGFDVWNPIMNFVTILLLTFSLFLVITGAFTAYFGSGKSRKIGVGLLVGGLIVGVLWGWYTGPGPSPSVDLVGVVVQSIGVIVAAVVGAAIAIGLFLLAMMKSYDRSAEFGHRNLKAFISGSLLVLGNAR